MATKGEARFGSCALVVADLRHDLARKYHPDKYILRLLKRHESLGRSKGRKLREVIELSFKQKSLVRGRSDLGSEEWGQALRYEGYEGAELVES